MTIEAIDLYKDLGLNTKDKLLAAPVVKFLRDLGPTRQWELVREAFSKAADSYLKRRQVLFFMADDTASAGPHIVRAFLSPDTNSFVVEITSKDENQSNSFPTVLHTIEVATTTAQLVQPQNSSPEILSYPKLTFATPEDFDQLQNIEPDLVLMPLIVDPKNTASLAFHSQARHLDPRAIAEGYYNLIKGWDLTVDLLRHTMLVLAKDGYNRPRGKTEVYVNILPTEEARRQFSLLNLGRIKMWEMGGEPTEKYQMIFR